jgi:hypothetical protein
MSLSAVRTPLHNHASRAITVLPGCLHQRRGQRRRPWTWVQNGESVILWPSDGRFETREMIMYISRRMGRLSSAGSMQWATDITAAVQAAGGMTSLWAGGPGSTFGTVAWSTMVDSFAAQAALTETLAGDALFQALVAQANNHIEELEADVLMQIVHGEITSPAPVGSYLTAITATINPDRADEATAFAGEIADAFTAVTKIDAVVGTYAAGPMGELTWLARFDNAKAVDRANAKIAKSKKYADVAAGGAGLFTDGNQQYARRVA